jgi:hypothetical protein
VLRPKRKLKIWKDVYMKLVKTDERENHINVVAYASCDVIQENELPQREGHVRAHDLGPSRPSFWSNTASSRLY